ncbi:copper-binding protein [Chitinibacteraceae bacterium HSL-7]
MKGINLKAALYAVLLVSLPVAATASEGHDHSAMTAKATSYTTRGDVKKVDAAALSATLRHAPVPELKWPAMTMGFKLADVSLAKKLVVGKTVEFDFVKNEQGYVITAVR